MELRLLRYFLAVAREENITRAAEALHITQPTLSRQLARMEEELGVQLFDRSARRTVLTGEGLLLRRRAEEIIALSEKAERELTEQDACVNGKISIGCGEIEGVHRVVDVCKAFHEKYPLTCFDFFTGNADAVQDQMDKGLLDLGLLLEPVNTDAYEFVRLDVRESWGVMMRKDDPLAAKERISADDLKSLPLILPRRNSVRNELASWFGEAYEDLQTVATSNLRTNSAVMVEKGLGCALTIMGPMPIHENCLTMRPLEPALTATSVLAWKRQQTFGGATRRFIQFLRTFLRG